MTSSDYKHYQSISRTFTYNDIPYTKLKQISDSIFNQIKFREKFGGEFSEIKLLPRKNYLL